MKTILLVAAIAALAFAAPASATTIVHDSDEPAIPNANDIEWTTASGRFVVGTGWLYTVTVKTRAPFTARPHVDLRVNGTVRYRLSGTYLRQSGGGKSRLTMTEYPVAGVVSYTFNATQIGGASSYEWFARSAVSPVDFAPDAGWAAFQRSATTTRQHVINTALVDEPWTELDPRLDRPYFDDLPECITC